jgi:hypothetical protein
VLARMIEKAFRYRGQRTSYIRSNARCTLYPVLALGLWSLVVSLALTGCLKSTYPDNYVKESVLEILRKEYNIPLAQVEITGKTIHLYLPVERLFTADLDDVKVSYAHFFGLEIRNSIVVWTARILSAPQDSYWELLARIYHLEWFRKLKLNWVETKTEKKKIEKIQDAIALHPEVQDEIGQMLFAVARVARSTDLKLDFYSAQITDVRSGHEFVLQGYLEDMNRLQLMDISQAEYHKRMLKDTRVNGRAQVHYPVRNFFLDLNQKTRDDVQQKYFEKLASLDWMDRFYFRDKKGIQFLVSQMTWEIKDVRSFVSPGGGRSLVYVKTEMLPRTSQKSDAPVEEEFLFEILMRGKSVQILRIIPFSLLSEMLASMPEFKMNDKSLQETIQTWGSEFEPKEVFLDDFLAKQMMMRLYDEIYQDERISNTFTDLHFELRFRDKPVREFVFDVRPTLKDPKAITSGKLLTEHEDMVYLLNQFVSRAAATLHSYSYKDFKSVAIELPDEGERVIVSPADLELFYRKKRSLDQVLQKNAHLFPIEELAS